MSERKQKRFWKQVDVAVDGGGFVVELDGRRLRTPAKALLRLPTRAMADAVAQEWDAQTGVIQPLLMPITRAANAAIDKIESQHAEVAEMLAAYGDADLVCYRAENPEALVRRQSENWDPVLDWAAETLGVRLKPQPGILHRPQAPEQLARLSTQVHAMSAFQLAGFHDLVTLSGSLILGFAAALGWRDADAIWTLSRLDETWQEERWGRDEEAQQSAEIKRQAFRDAKRFFDMC